MAEKIVGRTLPVFPVGFACCVGRFVWQFQWYAENCAQHARFAPLLCRNRLKSRVTTSGSHHSPKTSGCAPMCRPVRSAASQHVWSAMYCTWLWTAWLLCACAVPGFLQAQQASGDPARSSTATGVRDLPKVCWMTLVAFSRHALTALVLKST